ncbi:MAG: hypothetical protein FJ014_04270 [Chloroflexi bacterium]|nr:hypothetical protein [Chloroflexota bacterium]
MDTDYKVFTHLLDNEGHIVGQHDGLPGNGFRLTDVLAAFFALGIVYDVATSLFEKPECYTRNHANGTD